MISVSCLDSKFLNNNNWYGRFKLMPFKKGEGLTIANALRRTLLTEKSKFFISWVDLYNAEIPYSILTGMRESIFDILLNLKQIVFTSDHFNSSIPHSSSPHIEEDTLNNANINCNIGYICVKGPAIISAKNIKFPKGFKCIDPSKYILTLSDDGIFYLRFAIKSYNHFPLKYTPPLFKEDNQRKFPNSPPSYFSSNFVNEFSRRISNSLNLYTPSDGKAKSFYNLSEAQTSEDTPWGLNREICRKMRCNP
uniref:RNA polymerase alpha subunit n=1 Tax=Cephaleuros diffusus TaxID=1519597 RepID=UPI0030023A13